MNNKDTESYLAHNEGYIAKTSLEHHKREYVNQGTYGQYERFGYKKIVDGFPAVRSMHIDFGCGAGWLLTRTAGTFKKVVGVEPSAAAIETAREITKEYSNVEFINGDMVESFPKLNVTEPVFVTTTTVLSHIRDNWVQEFLKHVNTLPKGSTLFFAEPFDKNIQRKLWYVRSRNWWAENLPNWQLTFNDPGQEGKYGFGGVCVGKENVLARFPQSGSERVSWAVSGTYHKIWAGVAAVLRKLRVK